MKLLGALVIRKRRLVLTKRAQQPPGCWLFSMYSRNDLFCQATRATEHREVARCSGNEKTIFRMFNALPIIDA